MFYAKILRQNLRHCSFGVPRSASSSRTVSHRSLLIAAHTPSTLAGVLLGTDRTWITFSRFPPIFEACVTHFYWCCTHCIILKIHLNHLNSFHGGMLKFNAKVDADSLLCSLSHLECNGHTVHMLIRRCLLPPLTSTVKLSLLTHAHSSPLSLAARLYQCCTNCSPYINNGWTFPHIIYFASIHCFFI